MQRDFEFLDKQAFAADFGQALIENLIAARGRTENFHRHIGIKRTQAVADVVRLPQSQARLAGNDGDHFRRVGMNGVGHGSLLEYESMFVGGNGSIWPRCSVVFRHRLYGAGCLCFLSRADRCVRLCGGWSRIHTALSDDWAN